LYSIKINKDVDTKLNGSFGFFDTFSVFGCLKKNVTSAIPHLILLLFIFHDKPTKILLKIKEMRGILLQMCRKLTPPVITYGTNYEQDKYV
jgi:hypothetical protein